MGHTHDDGVMRAFADLLEKEGITICPSTLLLPELISPKGCWTRKKPGRAARKDIKTGRYIAGESLSFDRQEMIDVANRQGISIVAMADEDLSS